MDSGNTCLKSHFSILCAAFFQNKRNYTKHSPCYHNILFSFKRQFRGLSYGFWSRSFTGHFFRHSLGYYALLGTLTGYLCGKFNHGFFRENYATPVILSAVAAIVYETAVYITGFLFAGNLHYLHFLLNLILPEAVYTAIVTFVIYRILFSINDHIENKDKYKRKLFTIK